MDEKRRRFSPEKKLEILREHLKNRVPISELCKRYGIHPNMFYRWEKQFFEQGVRVFSERSKSSNGSTAKERRLQEKVRQKEAVIAWLTEENIRLKKRASGEI